MENYNPGVSMEEFIDMVQMDITVGCALPQNYKIVKYKGMLKQ